MGTPQERMERTVAEHLRSEKAVKRAEGRVRRLMAEGLTPEEWVARHGENTLIWSYGVYPYQDPDVRAWAQRVHLLLFGSPAGANPR